MTTRKMDEDDGWGWQETKQHNNEVWLIGILGSNQNNFYNRTCNNQPKTKQRSYWDDMVEWVTVIGVATDIHVSHPPQKKLNIICILMQIAIIHKTEIEGGGLNKLDTGEDMQMDWSAWEGHWTIIIIWPLEGDQKSFIHKEDVGFSLRVLLCTRFWPVRKMLPICQHKMTHHNLCWCDMAILPKTQQCCVVMTCYNYLHCTRRWLHI